MVFLLISFTIIHLFVVSKKNIHWYKYIQWVEKLSVHSLQLFSFFLVCFMETNFGASISDIS